MHYQAQLGRLTFYLNTATYGQPQNQTKHYHSNDDKHDKNPTRTKLLPSLFHAYKEGINLVERMSTFEGQ